MDANEDAERCIKYLNQSVLEGRYITVEKVNRNPISDEMQRMRQQVEFLQAELVSARGGVATDETRVLKERISWLEATNEDLCRELYGYRTQFAHNDHHETDTRNGGSIKAEGLKRSLQSTETFDFSMADALRGDRAGAVYIKLANCHLKLESKHEAASAYVDAANCYKKISPKGITKLHILNTLIMGIKLRRRWLLH